MQLKGTSSSPAVEKTKDTETLSKEERARQDLALLTAEEKVQEKKYQDAVNRYLQAQAEANQAGQLLWDMRSRKEKLKIYVQDLDNSIEAGRWYLFDRYNDHNATPLVYVVEVRRPRKYTWVTMFWFSPKGSWTYGNKYVVEPNTYEVSYIEANYPIFKQYLKEDTGQNRMGVLMRWGTSEAALLRGAKQLWGEQKPIRVNRDPEWEIKHRSENKRVLNLTKDQET